MADEQPFNPDGKFITRSGCHVITVILPDKIMGIVTYPNNRDATFCSWDLGGRKLNIFPREKGIHQLDLVNIEVEINS